VKILPVDSEHSAIFQCLQGEAESVIERIIITASGGPFRGRKRADLEKVTVAECLKHPNWSMGSKITVDSATLANKGLEVIEAKWLYGVNYSQIEAVVHPQSIIHSMVEFTDGAVMAQLGCPDMRIPIQYALTYPKREKSAFPRLDFAKMKDLTFEKPDTDTFLALKYAYEAGEKGGTMPCVFNAANEIAVNAFLQEKLSFLGIYDIIREAMGAHEIIEKPSIEALLETDRRAREFAAKLIAKAK
jgi:1-deoxy-D-xylulose-5-phosphate reductoisomerase